MVEDKIIQDKDKNDDYEDEDNENDVDDNKDNNSFSVYDDVATTNYTTPTTLTTPGGSTRTGDYDVMCNDNKNHKGNGNGSINNCCNLNNKSHTSKNNSEYNSDTDDITLPFKHGKPALNSNKKQQQQQQHGKQRATLKSNHGEFFGLSLKLIFHLWLLQFVALYLVIIGWLFLSLSLMVF